MRKGSGKRVKPFAWRWVVVLLLVLGAFFHDAAWARPLPEDVKPIAEKALSWALGGGLSGAKAFPESGSVDVVDLRFPPLTEIEIPGRKVVLSSLILLQGKADVSGSRPVLLLDAITVKDTIGKVSVSLQWLTSHSTPTTPPPVQGAVLQLEKRNGVWELGQVVERWP